MEDSFSLPGHRWWLDGPGELRGLPLRYLLTTILREAGRDVAVSELVAMCESQGVVFRGRASKIVSDALRWEIGWGRVARVRRGVYRSQRMPRSTGYWIARRVRCIRDYLLTLRARSGMPSTPTLASAPTLVFDPLSRGPAAAN